MSIMMETMGRKKARRRRSFTKEFKVEVVALVRQPGNSVASVARDLDLTETAVRAWVKQADVDEHMRAELVCDALRMAIENRRPAPGAMFHSDRGTQYTSKEFTDLLTGNDVIQSPA